MSFLNPKTAPKRSIASTREGRIKAKHGINSEPKTAPKRSIASIWKRRTAEAKQSKASTQERQNAEPTKWSKAYHQRNAKPPKTAPTRDIASTQESRTVFVLIILLLLLLRCRHIIQSLGWYIIILVLHPCLSSSQTEHAVELLHNNDVNIQNKTYLYDSNSILGKLFQLCLKKKFMWSIGSE